MDKAKKHLTIKEQKDNKMHAWIRSSTACDYKISTRWFWRGKAKILHRVTLWHSG